MSVSSVLPWEISVHDVDAARQAGQAVTLVDVRTSEELAIAAIEGALHIPMDQVPAEVQRIEAFADQSLVIVLCHHGVRSMNVVAWLRNKGIENCQSMAGGIERWSQTVDPGVPRY